MTKSKTVRIVLTTMVLALVAAASGHAWNLSHENKLTFNRPVALPGVVLPAGSYSFDLAPSSSQLDIVVVRSAAKNRVLYMGFTSTVQRPKSLPANAMVTFGEAAAHEAPPITAWYPIGDTTGHEFRY